MGVTYVSFAAGLSSADRARPRGKEPRSSGQSFAWWWLVRLRAEEGWMMILGVMDAGKVVLPEGTVTFLLTDVEQSTRMWSRDAQAAAGEGRLGARSV
jgi:hypothetical protein